MATILCIETSTEVCSIALERDGSLIGLKENTEGLNHSILAAPYIDELLKEQSLSANDLDAVAVGMGPGSYTGLRIGVSLAKGLCYGANLPLIAIPTLQALAMEAIFQFQNSAESPIALIPMIDARRMEVYSATFDPKGEPLTETEALIIDEHFAEEFLEKGIVLLFGNGSEKAKSIITSPNARFLDSIHATARSFAPLAEARFNAHQFEDVAYFEPYYLKEFITTTPKKRL